MDDTLLDAVEMGLQWRRDGFVVVRGLFSPSRAAQLADHMETIVNQWRECDHGGSGAAPANPGAASSIVHPLHAGYFSEGGVSRRRVRLLEAAADERVLRLGQAILGDRPCFRSLQYMINPTETSMDGNWHRDAPLQSVPVAPVPTPDEEGLLRENTEGGGGSGGCVQLQIALLPSDDVELVRGSHLVWDTPEQWHVRLADNKAHCRPPGSDHMPRAERIALRPGDALAFNPFGTHRLPRFPMNIKSA